MNLLTSITLSTIGIAFAVVIFYIIYRRKLIIGSLLNKESAGFISQDLHKIWLAFREKENTKMQVINEEYIQKKKQIEENELEKKEKEIKEKPPKIKNKQSEKNFSEKNKKSNVKSRKDNKSVKKLKSENAQYQQNENSYKTEFSSKNNKKSSLKNSKKENIRKTTKENLQLKKLYNSFVTLMNSGNTEKLIDLVANLKEKELSQMLEDKSSIKLEADGTGLENVLAKAKTKKELIDLIKKEIANNLKAKHQELKDKISSLRKKGKDVKHEELKSMKISPKIRMFETTFEKKDFINAHQQLTEVQNSLDKKSDSLKENEKTKEKNTEERKKEKPKKKENNS